MQTFPPPELTTQRLVLRALTAEDLDDLSRIVGNYDVAKWFASVPHPFTEQHAHAFLQDVQQGKRGTVWAIDHQGRFVGLISIGAELGYWCCPSVWGKGLMTEAANAAVSAYFTQTDAAEILANYFEGNAGSARVLEKAGFVETAPRHRFSLARNEDVPSRDMILTRARWRARQGDTGG